MADWVGAYIVVSKPFSEANNALNEIPYETLVSYHDYRDEEISEADLRILYAKWLMMVYEAYKGSRRDGDRWRIKGHDVVVSGGETYGDAPTDLCEAIWQISHLGICD